MSALDRIFRRRVSSQQTIEAQVRNIIRAAAAAAHQCVWYDPSDLSTMFQDSAGTTPVTAVEQSVGLILDKSGRGNHASQATTGYKPVLSARVNLLIKTEELGTSPWNALGYGTASAPSRTEAYAQSPIGTQKATRLQFALNGGTTSSDISQLVQNYSAVPSGAACSFAIWLRSTDGVSSYTMQIGVVGATQNVTITGQWTRFVVAGTGNGSAFDFQLRLRGGQAPAHSNAADVLAWGADLRLAGISGCPEYQRVNTATDYDTVGFPRYLKFDGSDDFLVTGNIDFSTTDKVAVAAGVRKLSDAATGTLLETSASSVTNNGAFGVFAPRSATANFAFGVRGSDVNGIDYTPHVSPTTKILSCVLTTNAVNAASAINGRIDGVFNAGTVNSSIASTGNFGNYPLHLGRRAGAFNPFNGHLYGLCILGGVNDIAKVAKIERLLAKKTGVVV